MVLLTSGSVLENGSGGFGPLLKTPWGPPPSRMDQCATNDARVRAVGPLSPATAETVRDSGTGRCTSESRSKLGHRRGIQPGPSLTFISLGAIDRHSKTPTSSALAREPRRRLLCHPLPGLLPSTSGV